MFKYISPHILIVLAIITFLVIMFWSQHVRADDALPGDVSCEQVRYYAGQFNIPDTTFGRIRARVIAAALGIRLTNAQLNAAARCLRSKTS